MTGDPTAGDGTPATVGEDGGADGQPAAGRTSAGRPAWPGPSPPCARRTEGGLAIAGAFHQPAVDGYEWHRGFDARLGLFDRDRNPRPAAGVPAAVPRPLTSGTWVLCGRWTRCWRGRCGGRSSRTTGSSTSRRTPHGRTPPSASGARPGYFASRAAPMGPVPAGVVIATFYNFNPEIVRAAIPAAWSAASPDRPASRPGSAPSTAPCARCWATTPSPRPRWWRRPRWPAAPPRGARPEGRPLFAAHAELAWPDEPHLALWHAVTILREFRGDGHVAALVTEGLDGCEALVTHGAAGGGIPPATILQATRGWSDAAWAAAGDRLRDRGLLDADDALTPAGVVVRDRVEQVTDDRAMAPWRHLGEDDADRLRTLVRPFSKAVAASGAFRAGPAS